MDSCVCAREPRGPTSSCRSSYLVCNFNPPVGDTPSLLTHTEAVTLFHEFGHTLHHLLTEVDYPSLAGINGVAWDAVELPSQFMENFVWRPEVLASLARHYQTGAPLPQDKLDTMQRSRTFLAALSMVRQLEFALFDFRLHHEYSPERGARVQEVLADVRREVSVVQVPAFNRFPNTLRARVRRRLRGRLLQLQVGRGARRRRVRARSRKPGVFDRATAEPLPARDPRGRRQPQRARRVRRVPRPPARARRAAAPVRHRCARACAVKVATWNVNSIKVRLEHVLAWLDREQPDVLALQEIKTQGRGLSGRRAARAGLRLDRSAAKPATTAWRSYRGSSPPTSCTGSAAMSTSRSACSARRSAACGSTACTCRTARTVESDKYRYKLGWLAALRNLLSRGAHAVSAARRRGRLQRCARRSRRLRSGRMGRSGALHSGRARGARIDHGARLARLVSSLRSAAGQVQLVGLSRGHVSPQSGTYGSTSCSRRVL